MTMHRLSPFHMYNRVFIGNQGPSVTPNNSPCFVHVLRASPCSTTCLGNFLRSPASPWVSHILWPCIKYCQMAHASAAQPHLLMNTEPPLHASIAFVSATSQPQAHVLCFSQPAPDEWPPRHVPCLLPFLGFACMLSQARPCLAGEPFLVL